MNTLLGDIEQEIQQSGGRYNLARLLMEENRSSFTATERKEIKQQALAEMLDSYQPYNKRYWTKEDQAYLIENWHYRSREKIAHKLRRSYKACEDRYYLARKETQANKHSYRWKQAS